MCLDHKKTAIISGVTGQDGSYLAELLLEKNYRVIGLKRRTSIISTDRVDHIFNHKDFEMRYWSLFDPTATYRLISEYQPDEVYNLAAQSHVAVSFENPIETFQGITNGTLYWLEAIKQLKPDCKFYQASSSEMFGRNENVPLNESSAMLPASPYACAKLAAHHLVQNYRESYGLFACSGILFNHESPRRGETFVTRKIIRGILSFMETGEPVYLGNLEAKRDWGHAKDYVRGMYLMLQAEEADDFVLATGETYSVRDFVEEACKVAGYDIRWSGEGLQEFGYYRGRVPNRIVEISEEYYRPQEVNVLLGDYSKAKEVLGWEPEIKFKNLVKDMYNKESQELES